MSFLMIENPVDTMPSVELMRMLGASGSRGQDSKIGQFGSGFPYSLALLARHNLLEKTKICLGKEVYKFELVDHNTTSGLQREIRMKKQNGASWDLNISTEFGGIDWRDVTLAVREFVSNACDGSYECTSSYKDVKVEIVDNDRAKDGLVRVYIPVNDAIRDYVDNLHYYFKCLSPGYNGDRKIYYNMEGGPARIYRKGVLVGSFGEHSLFHYDIPNITINESRLVDSYTARSYAAAAISTSENASVLRKYIDLKLSGDKSKWESELDNWYINPDKSYLMGDKKTRVENAWKEAVASSVAHRVICSNAITSKMVQSKGMDAIFVDDPIKDILIQYGAKSDKDVLNENEISGKEIIPATPQVIEMVDYVWDVLTKHNLTLSKDKPACACFIQHLHDGGMHGYYRPGGSTVYIRSDIANGVNTYSMSTVLEEISHYVTGAGDFTRELQTFAFNLSAILMMEMML